MQKALAKLERTEYSLIPNLKAPTLPGRYHRVIVYYILNERIGI